MTSAIDRFEEAEYERLLAPLWAYLARAHEPVPSDVIFVFGSRDFAVPRQAAQLYAAGLSSRVLVSGQFGPMTERVFDKPEALVFRDEMSRLGVPLSAIIAELRARNTLENVRFGMLAVTRAGHKPRSALLVAKAFVMRRCLATFARQYPAVDVRGCPPVGTLVAHRDRPRAAFAARLVGELHRLDRYGSAGDIEPQVIPPSIRATTHQVEKLLARS